MSINLASLLIDHPFGDDEGLLHTADRTVTAGEARDAARGVAERLGPLHGAPVAVQLPDGPGLVETMVGVWLAGGVHVPINNRLPETEVEAIVRATGAVARVTTTGIEPIDRAAAVAASHDDAAHDDAAHDDAGHGDVGLGDARHAVAGRDTDDVAFVMWTSGTTGRPKAIRHTHTAYIELLDRVLGPLRGGGAGTKRPRPNLIPVSMALNAGLYNALFGLRAGAALVIMDRFDPEVFAALVRRFEVRSTVLPPAAMAMLTDSAVTDLGPLTYVRSITAPLSPLQAQRFAAKFPVHVLNGYGQAEIGEVIGWTAADAKAHPDKIGAVGRPHPGVDIKLATDGRLLVRPPNTAVGIAERVDADGFVDTGDLARIDDDGFVWIEGRVGDLINRGGNKVFPDAVEEVLRLSPAVDDVAVVAGPDARLGEVPVAVLVGRPVPDDELAALCRAHLAAYKVPVGYHWVDALPRSDVGKVLRADLARSLATGSSDQERGT